MNGQAIQAIETTYNGIRFRSRLEASAVYFKHEAAGEWQRKLEETEAYQ